MADMKQHFMSISRNSSSQPHDSSFIRGDEAMHSMPCRIQSTAGHDGGDNQNAPRKRKRTLKFASLTMSSQAVLVVLFLTIFQEHDNNTSFHGLQSNSNSLFYQQFQVDAFVITNPTARRARMMPSSTALSKIASSGRLPTRQSNARQAFCRRPSQLWSTTEQETATVLSQKNASTATLGVEQNGADQSLTNGAPPSPVNGNSVNFNNNHQVNAANLSSTFPPNGMSLPDIPLPTANGGYSHTATSRAKISAANKGKTPWNKGKARSEEVRARIAAGVRARNRERLLKKLEEMGLTEEEYEEQKKEERRKKDAERRARRTPKGGFSPTAETRAKISKILKEKHANGEIKRRAVDPSKVRKGFKHSEETRRKISESLKKRWRDDDDYRDTMVKSYNKANSREETRKKISESLKRRWQDPTFRENMVQAIGKRKAPTVSYDSSYRQKISDAMKRKWQDPEYRSKTLNSIQKAAQNRTAMDFPRRKVKGTATARRKKKDAPELQLLTPLSAEDIAKRQKKKAKRKKKKSSVTTVLSKEDFAAVEPLKAPRPRPQQVTGAVETPVTVKEEIAEVDLQEDKPKENKKKKKKKQEKDGSVSRLREERRDLFDLLYGDEVDLLDDDYSNNVMEPAESTTMSKLGLIFGDEDLDSFDPYGLDDY